MSIHGGKEPRKLVTGSKCKIKRDRKKRKTIKINKKINVKIKILDSNYKAANLKDVVQATVHLNEQEREQLYKLLIKYKKIFDGTLGEWKTDPVDFELVDEAKPHSQRHYPVPHLYKETFKKELDRLVKLGVLEPVQQSEWGSPTFIVPKIEKTVRFVSDFRRLNLKIKKNLSITKD